MIMSDNDYDVNSYTFSVYFDAANSSCLNVSVENANSTFDACRY